MKETDGYGCFDSILLKIGGENYFGGAYRNVTVGSTEKAAEMIASLTGPLHL